MHDLKKIKSEFLAKLKGKVNLSEINQIKSDLFGKSGLISSQFKKIGTIEVSKRKKFASDLNFIKDELQGLINLKIKELENVEINEKLENIEPRVSANTAESSEREGFGCIAWRSGSGAGKWRSQWLHHLPKNVSGTI